AIARQTGIEKQPDYNAAGIENALGLLEDALGLVRSESGHGLFPNIKRSDKSERHDAADFNIDAMTRFLDGKYAPVRQKVRQILSGPEFEFSYGLELDAHREQVHTWLQNLV